MTLFWITSPTSCVTILHNIFNRSIRTWCMCEFLFISPNLPFITLTPMCCWSPKSFPKGDYLLETYIRQLIFCCTQYCNISMISNVQFPLHTFPYCSNVQVYDAIVRSIHRQIYRKLTHLWADLQTVGSIGSSIDGGLVAYFICMSQPPAVRR